MYKDQKAIYTTSKDEILYMFAIIPSDEISTLIHEQRLIFAKNFSFHGGLKPPVHITICYPFIVPDIISEAFERQMLSLQAWANNQTSFEINLDGFDFFPNPDHPALIVKILDNIYLQNMQKSFAAYLNKMKFRKCSSRIRHHITIGYKDIPTTSMPAIIEAYTVRPFKASFKCDRITLWKHDRINWRTAADYKFN